MRWVKSVKLRRCVSEETIRSILCQWLSGARGNVYTIKTFRLCAQMLRSRDVPMTCMVAVRHYVLSVLQDAIVGELSKKDRITVQVNVAREVLRCGYED